MLDWMSSTMCRAYLALKREEGQGATEYAMVIGFLVVALALTVGFLGDSIEVFLNKVGDKLEALTP
jgi:Flp pilus assembly pilin Flp